MAKQGHDISVIGRREPPAADRSIPGVKHWIADLLAEDAGTKAALEAVGQTGPLNYLVLCQRFRGAEDAWTGEFQVSLTASRRLIDALLPKFTSEGDRGIVFVSSVFGDRVGEGQAISYHAMKAAMNHMARFYAVNLGKKGIRSNIVTPFTFLKEESRQFYIDNKQLHQLYRDMIPLGRMGTTEDSANAIAFLCSTQASFINGQNLYVDGGLSLVWPETLARQIAKL